MRFHHVVEGDPLNNHSESKVVTGSYDCTIQGPDGRQRAQAFLRHNAYCGVCKTLGEIAVGPGTPGYNLRMYDGALQSYEAVEGDIVLCNCDRLPKLVAVYARCSYIEDQSHAHAISGAAAGVAGLAAVARASAADDASMERAAYGDPQYWTAQVGPPAPGTTNPSFSKELSGSQWVSRYPTSTSTSDLVSPFREHVDAFIATLQAADAIVSINATLRPPERVYLMHYSYAIANGTDPSSVPEMDGVAIDWVHRDSRGNPDLSASQSAAEEMVSGYGIAYPPALSSRHIEGRAIDMTISNFVGKTFTDGNGVNTAVANQGALEALGSSYGVIKLRSDPPHWSDDGH